jgi:transposase
MIEPVLGIDIAKLKFNLCLINQTSKLRHRVLPNTVTGFEQLLDGLSKQGIQRAHACLEATGTYGEALSLFLHEAGHTVSVINPAAVKAFAQSRLSRTTTDGVDAELITDIKQYRNARQVAAYAGLVPRERQSGSSVRGRTKLSKIGNARLRKALYFPAITALRCSPFFQAWAEGLRARGKGKMSVICAVMRKLVHLAFGVLKTGQRFDPEWAKTA